MTITTHNDADKRASRKVPSRLIAYGFYSGSVTLAMAAAAVLISTCARAQTAELAQPVQASAEPLTAASAPASAALPAASQTAAAKPKYSARDIQRAFSFIDANKDGKISREEAAGFRNVAKYFDAADIDKNNALSLEEFGNALNRP